MPSCTFILLNNSIAYPGKNTRISAYGDEKPGGRRGEGEEGAMISKLLSF